ncbi:MAG: PAS domain S-box protein, partial [Bdellovibrionia bacterium]
VIAPFLLVWGTWISMPPPRIRPKKIVEAVLLYVASALIYVTIFFDLPLQNLTGLNQPYWVTPIIVWTALRFGQHGSVLMTLFLSIIAIGGTSNALGPFVGGSLTESLMLVQNFTSIAALTSLILSASLTEREQNRKHLEITLHAAEKNRALLAASLRQRKRATTESKQLTLKQQSSSRRLSVQYASMKALSSSQSIKEAAPKILEAIGNNFKWDVGAFWEVNEATSTLHAIETWCSPAVQVPEFIKETFNLTLPEGQGLPGRVLFSGEPAWIENVTRDLNFPRIEIAAHENLHGAFAFPIFVEDKVLGVVEFFSRDIRPPDYELLETVASIGGNIGQFLERKKAQESLARSYDELEQKVKQRTEDLARNRQLLLDAERLAHLGSWEWDIIKNKIILSEELYRIYDLDPKQFDGTYEKMLSIIHPDDRELLEITFARTLSNHEDFSIRKRILRPDRSIRILQSYGRVNSDATGKLIRLYGASLDITEYKLLRDEFEKSERRFQALVEGIKDYAVLMLDPQGHIESWNEGAKSIKGYEDTEIIGKHISIFYPELEVKKGTPDMHLRLAAERGRFEAEGWRLRKDGSLFWANVVITPIRDPNGNLIGYSKVTSDRTEWKRSDIQIKAGEAKFRGLVEWAPDAIVIANETGQIVLINKQAELCFGYDRSDLMGRPLEILIPEEFREIHVFHRTNYIANPSARPMGKGREVFGRRKDGTQFPIDVFLSPLKTETGLLISTSIRDITERRKSEKEKEKLLIREQEARIFAENAARMRDELVAIVSHDLKNPLTGILVGANLIRRMKWLDERGKRQLELIELSAKNMNRIIGELLDVYKTETGGYRAMVEQDHAPCKALSIVETAVELQQAIASEKKIKIEIDVCPSMPIIDVNRGLIGQVFQNLIGNSIKFTPEGGLIQIRTKATDKDVIFSIRDTGPGIEKNLIPELFERFSQDKKTARLGTGLGLVIAKGIVEAHGGKIWVKSKVKVGTTFYFSIPIASQGSLKAA